MATERNNKQFDRRQGHGPDWGGDGCEREVREWWQAAAVRPGRERTLWCTRLCVTWLVNVPQLCLFLLTVFDTLAHEVWFCTMFYANVNPRTYVHYEHSFVFPVKAMSIVEKVKMDYSQSFHQNSNSYYCDILAPKLLLDVSELPRWKWTKVHAMRYSSVCKPLSVSTRLLLRAKRLLSKEGQQAHRQQSSTPVMEVKKSKIMLWVLLTQNVSLQRIISGLVTLILLSLISQIPYLFLFLFLW